MQELLKFNKQHWMKVRHFHVTKRHRRLNQFRHRLATLIPDPTQETASPPLEQPSEHDEAEHTVPQQAALEAREEAEEGTHDDQGHEIVDTDMQADGEERIENESNDVQQLAQQQTLNSLEADPEAMAE